MKKPVKIGNSQGFWGDSPNASFRLLSEVPDMDYLTLDYLAEVSLSIMAIQREKNPDFGYAKDFLDVITSLVPHFKNGSKCKIITNAGGLNPFGLAKEIQALLKQSNLNLKIGVVSGDDVLGVIQNDLINLQFNNLDTKKPIKDIADSLVTANAYFGAKPIIEALSNGADIVITGRVADPSLCVAACSYHYEWKKDNYNALAGATIAGHLIECGTQVTGGISTDWLKIKDPANLGFPVVEVFEDGSFVITKSKNSSGVVNEQTVKEQLLYEIADPANYLSPDVRVSFLELTLSQIGKNRILVKGALGFAPPNTYKVSASYRNGFRAEGTLAIFGEHAAKKARLASQIILDRVKGQGFDLKNTCIEALGALNIVPGVFKEPKKCLECVLRVAVSDLNYKAVECFTKEIAPLVTSGPQGVTGYISGRPHIREVFGFWPCLIQTDRVTSKSEVL